jgi:hypothetical protein
MFGAQGAFAQVLPVPRGRTIRGRGAVVGGALLLAFFVLGVVGVFFAMNGLFLTATVFVSLSVLSLLGFGAVYFWMIPAAVRDFDQGR